jgi:hemerythrin-like metal-binding protein
MPEHFSILLIEDENIDSKVNQILLGNELFEIKPIHDATEAWNYLREERHLDLIVLNLNVPDTSRSNISAENILQSLRINHALKDTPLIVLTDKMSNQNVIEQNLVKNVDLVIQSPFDPVLFIAAAYRAISINLERHIRQINQQHLGLAQKFGKILASLDRPASLAAIPGQFKSIEAALITHFSYEEKFMRIHRYPDLEAHIRHHHKVISQVQNLKEKQIILTRENLSKVKDMILGDDYNHDRQYINFIKQLTERLSINLELMQY